MNLDFQTKRKRECSGTSSILIALLSSTTEGRGPHTGCRVQCRARGRCVHEAGAVWVRNWWVLYMSLTPSLNKHVWVPSCCLAVMSVNWKALLPLGSSRKLQAMRHHYISLSLLGNIVIQRFLEGHYIARFFEDEIMQNKPFGKGFFFQI